MQFVRTIAALLLATAVSEGMVSFLGEPIHHLSLPTDFFPLPCPLTSPFTLHPFFAYPSFVQAFLVPAHQPRGHRGCGAATDIPRGT